MCFLVIVQPWARSALRAFKVTMVIIKTTSNVALDTQLRVTVMVQT